MWNPWRWHLANRAPTGLLLLSSQQMRQELPSSLAFWRSLARDFFHAVCQLGEAGFDRWASLAPPSAEQFAQIVADAPPMRGLEYLNVELLRRSGANLPSMSPPTLPSRQRGRPAFFEVSTRSGICWARDVSSGREQARPRAPVRVSGDVHASPVGPGAARTPAAGRGAQDLCRSEGDWRSSNRCWSRFAGPPSEARLVRELLDSKALFAPQAWSDPPGVSVSHRSAADRSSGRRRAPARLVVGPPSAAAAGAGAARRRSRPSELGLDRLLGFRGRPGARRRTAHGRRATASFWPQTDGLLLLRGKWVEVDQTATAASARSLETARNETMPTGSTSSKACGSWPAPTWGRSDDGRCGRSRLVARHGRRLAARDARATAAARAGRRLPARPRSASDAAALSGRGRALALVHDGTGPGRLPGRRHGAGQDDSGDRSAACSANGSPAREGKPAATPSLLVVPASLMGNWRQELARFAPSLAVFFAHRSECDAEELARVAADPR